MMRRVLLTVLLSFSLHFASPVSGDIDCPNGIKLDLESKKEFKQLLEKSVFQVLIESDGPPQKEETIGTATLVSNKGYLLTAAHIFEPDNKRILEGLDSKQLRLTLRIPVDESKHFKYRGAYVRKLSEKYDLSVIELSDWDNNRRFEPIWLDVKSNPHDYEARLMGYMVDERFPTISGKGNIIRTSNFDGYLRATSLEAYQGYSGGLLISSDGMGIAVLSGKFEKYDDEQIAWSEIGDMENGALNAAPLRAVIDDMANLDLDKTKEFISRLRNSKKTIPDHEITDLIRFDRLAAIVLVSKLKNSDEISKLANWENQWSMFELTRCLMPPDMTKDMFFKLRQASISEEQKKWFGSEVAKYALKEARETKDLEYSLGMYGLAIAALNKGGLGEAYANYAYLDYYNAAVKANNQDLALANKEAPSAIIGSSISRISERHLDFSDTLKPVSVSRALLFSAATSELNKKGRYYEGLVAASAALKSKKKVNDAMIKDWYFMNSKAIGVVKDKKLREKIKTERRAVNVVFYPSSGRSVFAVDLDKISTPTSAQLLQTVKQLGTIQ